MTSTDHERSPLDRARYPLDDWALTETRFDAARLGHTETLFAVGNGYFGMRGNIDEGREGANTAPTSTASTRRGRSGTPRRPSASQRSGRRSSTRPTRR